MYPEITALTASIKAKGGELPLVGRFTDAEQMPHGGGGKAWRWYSPDALDAVTGEYNHLPSSASLYLSNVDMIGAVQEAIFRCDGCDAYGVCERNQGPGVSALSMLSKELALVVPVRCLELTHSLFSTCVSGRSPARLVSRC